jgi:pimeloyl-ACP methyl ester carboxylesterase
LETQLVEVAEQDVAPQGSQSAFVEVGGIRLHHVHAGSGRPVVLIHGLVGSAANWRRNIDALSGDASVYAIDLANMGQSARVPGLDTSLSTTGDRVAAWMTAVGLDCADIVGHSHGGAVAMMLAARHPERVRSLVLFAPANPYSNAGDTLIRIYSTGFGRWLARVGPYLPRRAQLFLLGRMYGNPKRIVVETLDGYVAGSRIPGTVDHVLGIVRGWHTEMAALKAILPSLAHLPTLLIWGDRDRAVSVASGLRLHRDLPGSELMVVPGSGHLVFQELPEETNQAMRAWLARGHAAASRPARVQPLPVATRPPLSSNLQHLSPGL